MVSMFFLFGFYCRIHEAGYQFTKALDLQLIDDLGFSKRYTRFLQVFEDLTVFVFL